MSCGTIHDGTYIESEEQWEERRNVFNKRIETIENSIRKEDWGNAKEGISNITADLYDNISRAVSNTISNKEIKKLGGDQLVEVVDRLRKNNLSPTREDFDAISTYANMVVDTHMYLVVLERIAYDISIKSDDEVSARDKAEILNTLKDNAAIAKQIVADPSYEEVVSELTTDNIIRQALDDIKVTAESIEQKEKESSIDFKVDVLWDALNEDLQNNTRLKSEIQMRIATRNHFLEQGVKPSDKVIVNINSQIKRLKNQMIDKDLIKRFILSPLEDASRFDFYFIAARMSSDPIIATFAESVIDMKKEVEYYHNKVTMPKIQDFQDRWLAFTNTDLKTAPSLGKLYDPFIEYRVIKTAKIKTVTKLIPTEETDEFGDIINNEIEEKVLEEKIEVVGEHRDSFDTSAYHTRHYLKVKADFAKYQLRKATEENKEERKKASNDAAKAHSDFIHENFESKYNNEYYEVFNNIDDDIKQIYVDAKQKTSSVLIQLSSSYSLELEEEFYDLSRQEKNLFSTVDLKGKPKKGRELEIAEKLSAWKDGKQKIYKSNDIDDIDLINAAEERRQTHRTNKLKELKRRKTNPLSKSEIDRIMRFFDQTSTRLVKTNSYTDTLKRIRDRSDEINKRINEILNISISEKETNLNNALFEKTKSYFKDDGTVDADNIPKELKSDIHEIQEKLQKLYEERSSSKYKKTSKESLNALNKAERDEYFKLVEELKGLNAEKSEIVSYETTAQYDNAMDRERERLSQDPDNTTSDAALEKALVNSEWYQKNHYITKYYNSNGELVTTYKPLRVWQYSKPLRPEDVTVLPAYRYFSDRSSDSVRDEYKNPNYIKNVLMNMSSVKKGSKYDKSSKLYDNILAEQLELLKEYKDGSIDEVTKKLTEQQQLNIQLYQGDSASQVRAFVEESLTLWTEIQGINPITGEGYADNKLKYKLPSKRKSQQEKLLENYKSYFTTKPKDIINSITQEFKAAFRITEDDKDKEMLQALDETDRFEELNRGLPDYNRIYSPIPIRYKGSLPFGQQSHNLMTLYADFALDDSTRIKMEKEKFIYTGILDLVLDNTVGVASGGSYYSSTNNKSKVENIRAKHLEEIIKSQFFGETRKEAVAAGFDLNKIVDGMSGLTALMTLSHNYPGSIVNFSSATVQTLLEAFGKKFFTVKDMVKADKEFAKYMARDLVLDSVNFRAGNKSWSGNFADYWRFFQGKGSEVGSDRLGQSVTSKSLSTRLFSNTFRDATEIAAQASSGIAMMIATKVHYLNEESGEYVYGTLFDAYRTLDLISIREKPGSIKLDNNGEIGEEWTLKKEKQKINQIEGINIKINGNYSKINKMVVEKYAAVKSIFFFRKFLTPHLENRFGGLTNYYSGGMDKSLKDQQKLYNLNNMTGDYGNGFYPEAISTIWHYLLPSMFIKGSSPVKVYKYLSDNQKYALGKFGFDLSAAVTLKLAFFLLGGFDDDDYNEYSWLKLHALYQIKKVSSETEQFTVGGFDEFKKLMSTPSIALAVTSNKLSRASGDLFNYATGDESAYYKRDTPGMYKKGDLRFKKDVLDMLGLKFRMMYPEQMLKSFRYAERIR